MHIPINPRNRMFPNWRTRVDFLVSLLTARYDGSYQGRRVGPATAINECTKPDGGGEGGDCGSNHLVLFVSYIPLSCFKLAVNCKIALASTLLGRQLQVMQAPRLVQRTLLSRPIHCSAIRQNRGSPGDDLFSADVKSPTHNNSVTSREQQFHKLVQFVTERTGRRRVNPAGQVRQSAWLRLFQLASKPEHLERVSEMFPRWRDSGKTFKPAHAEMFARRCEELKCPLLALKIFGDHTKYGFGMTSLPAGRQLLHSLYDKYPLENTITAASLFGVYGLPSVANDLTSTAVLYASCVRSKDPHAQVVAKNLKRQFTKQIVQMDEVKEPTERLVRAQHGMKSTIWLAKAIRQIKTAHREQGLPPASFLGMWNAEKKPRRPQWRPAPSDGPWMQPSNPDNLAESVSTHI